ncbi:MAG: hypothetical protein KDB33_02080, partial [Acidimicrobiales bacterium]|nr:hypothetical protein [Acidimicrobiales bacterium]
MPHAHPPADANEGVRIIGKEDAREAKRQNDATKRPPRSTAPPDGVTPALSFPLDDDTEATEIERPKPAPVLDVSPPTGEHALPHWTEPA